MAENLMKVPAKGILKNSTSFESSGSHKCAASRGTKWDEMNILATHHPPDKDYGHMKIEEPKTPFSYQGDDSGDESLDLDAKLLVEKLQVKAGKCQESRYCEEESDEEEEDEEPETKEKRRSFENKRKAHYNEYMAVKLARQLMQKDEDDDDVDSKEKLDQDQDGSTEEDAIPAAGSCSAKVCPEGSPMDTKDSNDEHTS